MLSVIETGGKQYVVSVGQKIRIEKWDGKEGDAVVFDKVLLLAPSENELKIGEPYIKGVTVMGEIVRQGRAEKLIVFRYKPKKRERKKKGHRQLFTEVRITDIKNRT